MSSPAARGRRAGDRRSRLAARPCCRSGCTAGRVTRRAGPTTLRMLTASRPDSRRSRPRGHDLVRVEVEIGGPAAAVTAPSPACRRRPGRPCAGAPPAARRRSPRRAPRCAAGRRRRARQARVDLVELSGEYPPANTPTSDVLVTTRSCAAIFGHAAAREPDGEQAAVARERARRVLGELTADRVVDEVDAVAVGGSRNAGASGPSRWLTVASAPSPRQNAARSSSLTTAMTCAPSARPSCTAAMPLPPAAPSTASRSPGRCRRGRRARPTR